MSHFDDLKAAHIEELMAENKRLRNALEKISSYPQGEATVFKLRWIALKALEINK